MIKTHNIFISHSWKYGDSYDRLKNLLNQRPYFSFKDYSIPQNNPVYTYDLDNYLQQKIYEKMRFCHVILVMAGVYTTYSRWINKEILIANTNFTVPKPIIGVRPRGQMNISTIVRENAIEIVNWNTETIVSAIRRHSLA